MKRFRRYLSILLVLAMLCACIPMNAVAAEYPGAQTSRGVLKNQNGKLMLTEEKSLRTESPEEADPDAYGTCQEAGLQMRQMIKDLGEELTLYVRSTERNVSRVMEAIWNKAVEHTGNPVEGDYLLGHFLGAYITWTTRTEGEEILYTLQLSEVVYYTSAEMEAQLDEAVDALLRGELALDESMSDYEKLKAVYDWVCGNIYYHEDPDANYPYVHSAYAALVDRQTVCQGYATLLYRLLLSLGVNCRYIGGYVHEGPESGWDGLGHAWNIVELDGVFYGIDATWDADYAQMEMDYEYFLLGRESFADHAPDPEFATAEYVAAHPMAEEDYFGGSDGDGETVPEIVSGQCGDDLTWTMDEFGFLTISGSGPMWEFLEQVPGWKECAYEPVDVYIEEGVTSIGAFAFSECPELSSVTVPTTVTEVGHCAFGWLEKLMCVDFLGSAPLFAVSAFIATETSCWYPYEDESWTEDVLLSYTGNITWYESYPDEDEDEYEDEIYWPITGQCGNDMTWTVDEFGTLTISGTGRMWDFTEETPGWTNYSDYITDLVVEEGVPHISAYAFTDCEWMWWATIAATVTEVGEYAFAGCTELWDVTFLGSAPVIGENAFQDVEADCWYPGGDESWTEDVLQDYGGTLYWYADNTALQPDSWPVAGQCGDEVTWELNENGTLTISGAGPMWDFEAEAPGWAEYEAFVIDAYIEEGVTTVGDRAFAGCTSLMYVEIAATVTEVGAYAFADCDMLLGVGFLGSAPAIGENAFHNVLTDCLYYEDDTWTEAVLQNYGGELTWYAEEPLPVPDSWPVTGTCGDGLTWELDEEGLLYISGEGAMTDYMTFYYTFEREWDDYADYITGVLVGEGVTDIGVAAFAELDNLEAVLIASTVKRVGGYAFGNCWSLELVQFLGDAPVFTRECTLGAFLGDELECSYPESNETWTEDVMLDYGGSVIWSDYSDQTDKPVEGGVSGQCGDGLTWELDEEGLLFITGEGSMWDFERELPEWYAYSEHIKTVIIDETVTHIGSYAFNECTKLEAVLVGESVASVGEWAFAWCTSLFGVQFLGDAPAFGEDAFLYAMTECGYPEGNETWTEDVMQAYGGEITWTAIWLGTDKPVDGGVSGECGDGLTWELDEEGLLFITGEGPMEDNDQRAPDWYAYSDHINTVIIDDTVTHIGSFAFNECRNLEAVLVGESVASVGQWAFAWCPSLYIVQFTGDAPVIGEDAFLYALTECAYPENNDTWTEDVMQNYGGELTWTAIWLGTDKPVDGGVSGECGLSLTWSLDEEGLLTISGEGPMEDYDHRAPDWYAYSDHISRIVIEDGVTHIGSYAFNECRNLESVQVGASVEGVGEWAFAWCSSLTCVEFTGDAPVFDEDAFVYAMTECRYPADNATWTDEVLLAYGGEITWTPVGGNAGDMDGSGQVNADDAIYLLYHVLFGDLMYPVTGSCDFDGSGAVTSDDAIYLLYYTLFGDALYPLN